MNAHAINSSLRALAELDGFTIADPGNGETFEFSERLINYCDLTVSGSGQTRLLPLNCPNGTILVARNLSESNAVSIADQTDPATKVKSVAASKIALCIKTTAVGAEGWHFVSLDPGSDP